MRFEHLEARYVTPRLKQPFSIGEVNGQSRVVGPQRDMVVLQATTSEGIVGWGSIDALPFPFYNQEWTGGAWQLVQEVGKNVVGVNHDSPEEIIDALGPIVGHNMLKAAFANLFMDAKAQLENVPLFTMVGGVNRQVEVGISIPKTASQEEIEKYIAQGFKRIKVKIGPSQDDFEKIKSIKMRNSQVALMIDANSSFDYLNQKHMELLGQFGRLDLLMIEQPLAHDDVRHHIKLQKFFYRNHIPGRICLDESIESWDQLKQAVEGGIPIINFKVARVGGLHIAKDMIEYCQKHHVQTWVGGMLETTLSKAQSLALATHPGVTLPSDISGTDAYFVEGDDPCLHPMRRNGGTIEVPCISGRGWEVDQHKLAQITRQEIVIYSRD